MLHDMSTLLTHAYAYFLNFLWRWCSCFSIVTYHKHLTTINSNLFLFTKYQNAYHILRSGYCIHLSYQHIICSKFLQYDFQEQNMRVKCYLYICNQWKYWKSISMCYLFLFEAKIRNLNNNSVSLKPLKSPTIRT